MASSVAVALAARTARLNDDVAELCPPVVERTVEDKTATDAGPKREHHKVRRPATRSEPPLRQRGGVSVVLDSDRSSEPLLRVGPEIEVLKREIRRLQSDACR